MLKSFKKNWPLYCIEGLCLGLFMVSAIVFTTMLEYPGSVVHQALPNDFNRLCLTGLAMGGTATCLIESPFGKKSGAHMNPAITIVFLRLGKISKYDAAFYVLFQMIGGVFFVFLMVWIIGTPMTLQPVNYVITAPGKYGATAAFFTEIAIAFGMMSMVLATSKSAKLSDYTGILAGCFVMTYVILTGPVSGFGMNPARSLASAIPAWQFPSFWIYVTAPFIGMFAAAEIFVRWGKTFRH